MTDVDIAGGDLPVLRAGEKLRRARERAGIELAEVTAWTRIKQPHLLAIEQSDFAALPGRIYAIGFARTYAQAVGLDPEVIAREVRQEFEHRERGGLSRPAHHLEIGDPAKIPSRRLAQVAAVLVLVVLAAVAIYRSSYLTPAAELPPVTAEESPMVIAPELSPAAMVSPTAESAVAAAAAGQPTGSATAAVPSEATSAAMALAASRPAPPTAGSLGGPRLEVSPARP